jgi:hypothetical protein
MTIYVAAEFAIIAIICFFALTLESYGVHYNEGMVLSLLFLGILTTINIGLAIADNIKNKLQT